MKLDTLQANGLKNLRDVSLPTPKLLALQGPNGSGKTSVHQAIKLGILGFDPLIGRTLPDTRKLAGGDGEIEVGLTFDTGFSIHRTLGASTTTKVWPHQGERTEADMKKRITDETGAFLPSFDLSELFQKSTEKRRAALFDLLPKGLLHLEESSYREWLGYERASDAVKRAIDKVWAEKINAADSPSEGLATAIDFAREKFNEAEKERREQTNVVESVEAAARNLTEREVAQTPENIDELQAKLSAVERRLGTLREQQEEAGRSLRRRHEYLQRRDLLFERIQKGEARVAEIIERRDKLTVPSEPQRREAEAAFEIALTEHEAARERVGELRLEVIAIRTRGDGVRSQLKEAQEKLARIADLPECPVCGSTEDLERARWSLEEHIAALEKSLADAVDEQIEAEKRVSAAGLHLLKVEEQENAARSRRETIRGQLEELRKITQDLGQVEALLLGVREEAARLDADANEPIPPATAEVIRDEVDTLEPEATSLRERIRSLQEVAKEAGRAEAARERADRERRHLVQLTERAKALKGIYGALQKYRGHVIQHMVSPVENAADALLQRIDPAKRFRFVFEREGKDTFDFGFEEGGVFRSYDAASTGEDAFLVVVFVTALIDAVQPAWRVLLVDNAEAIDDQRRAELMGAIALVQDALDNVILSGCCSFAEAEGWEIVDVPAITGATLVAA